MAKLKVLLKGFLQLFDLSKLELCTLHFDDKVDQLFINFTKKYGNTQKNYPTFNINKNNLWDFFLPTFCVYQSNDADLSSQFARELNVTKQI